MLGAVGITILMSGCTPIGAAIGAGAMTATASQQEKGFDHVVSDSQIRLEINHLWFQSSEKVLMEVGLEVQEGRVLLTGLVEDPEIRSKAVALAWQADGVKEVINEIEVGDDETTSDLAHDFWITTQLNTAILLDQKVSSIDYSVDTVDQVVYLMGVARSQAELERVIGHAKSISYVRRVVSHVRVKAAPQPAS